MAAKMIIPIMPWDFLTFLSKTADFETGTADFEGGLTGLATRVSAMGNVLSSTSGCFKS
jgi:hypothetical protein